MSQNNWKSVERSLAKRMNGQRVPVSGRTGAQGMESPDIDHDLFSIEVKSRESIPSWVEHSFDQAEASRKPHHIAAICIYHIKGKRHDRDVVLLSLKDFENLQEML